MNVNPFSYLIEKLKGKVNKSGDTMTGNLIISRNAATSELELGNNTTSKGLIILFSNNDKYEVLRSPDGMTANRNIYLPDASGTVALTSDIANMPITLHKQIATNESVSFEIPNNGLATIVVGHPYTGTWGEYAVIGGYTTGSNAITTFHASTAVSSIVKTSNNIIKLTCNSGIFVYCTGVGVSLV